MKKIGIIYGSTTGTCGNFASQIAEKLGVASSDVIDVSIITKELVQDYEVLILGSSTWGYGELQDDWYDGINTLKSTKLGGKIVALFGCGDAESYGETFCNAMGLIFLELENSGCTFIGFTENIGYIFNDSAALIDDMLVGLALDDVNDGADINEERINNWIEKIKPQIA